MIDPKSDDSPLKKLGMIKRKAFGITEHGLVRTEHLATDNKLPLVVKPVVKSEPGNSNRFFSADAVGRWQSLSCVDLGTKSDFRPPRCGFAAGRA